MLFRNCIGNLNKNMHPLVFCWTGGAEIILTAPVILVLVYLKPVPMYTGGIRTSCPGNCRPYEIIRLLAVKYISAAHLFFPIRMAGMIHCALNYYNYPALIAPMPWIDSVRPSLPVVHSHNSQDSLVFRFERGNVHDTLKGFAVYKAEGAFNIDSARVFRFIPNSQTAETAFPLK